jgi:hypothetical protein
VQAGDLAAGIAEHVRVSANRAADLADPASDSADPASRSHDVASSRVDYREFSDNVAERVDDPEPVAADSPDIRANRAKGFIDLLVTSDEAEGPTADREGSLVNIAEVADDLAG